MVDVRIPDRLFSILRSAEDNHGTRFPPTEVFNEGWMLRLVLDAFESLEISSHPLSFEPGSRWFSEARLESPFRPRTRGDALGEGFTNADGVIANTEFRETTRAGLKLSADAKQFVVVEAKMFSNLSSGTKNAQTFDQAARNIACMAEALAKAGLRPDRMASLGFYVVAPKAELRTGWGSNLEMLTNPESVLNAARQRISSYEELGRGEYPELRQWEADHFLPLVEHLETRSGIAVLSWEECISTIADANAERGQELSRFYERCLEFSPSISR